MKKCIKILLLIMIALLLLTTVTFGFKPSDLTGNTNIDTQEVEDLANYIIGIIQIIASATSVIVLLVIGIKYMLGSVEEKASYKKTMLPYVIGAVIVFIAPYIAQGIYNMAKELQNSSYTSPIPPDREPTAEDLYTEDLWQN